METVYDSQHRELMYRQTPHCPPRWQNIQLKGKSGSCKKTHHDAYRSSHHRSYHVSYTSSSFVMPLASLWWKEVHEEYHRGLTKQRYQH